MYRNILRTLQSQRISVVAKQHQYYLDFVAILARVTVIQHQKPDCFSIDHFHFITSYGQAYL